MAQVAAVNCDEESNKQLCGAEGVTGFPTLKLVKPSKKPGKPIVEDYRGPREAKDIIEAVKVAIPNNVKKITDKGLEEWLDSDKSTAKAILFSDKGVTSALTKVLANEFLGSMNFAQIRDKEAAANQKFGIVSYPTLLVLEPGREEPIEYDGAFTKAAMHDFLAQHASPADFSSLKDKIKKAVVGEDKDTEPVTAAKEDESSFSSASSSHQSSEASAGAASATSETLVEDSNPTESPEPAVTPDSKPVPLPNVPEPIASLLSPSELQVKCLGEKTSTCVLALLPTQGEEPDQLATTALTSLAEIAEKHKERQGHLFPFYAVPASNGRAATLRTALKLSDEASLALVAVNGRRGWFRVFEGQKFDSLAVENWVDNIRFGEGAKGKLPDELLVGVEQSASAESTAEEPSEESTAEESVTEETTAGDEPTPAPTHGEL